MQDRTESQALADAAQIAAISAAFPQLRLGQLISNCLPLKVDIFYVEDVDLMRYLREYADEYL